MTRLYVRYQTESRQMSGMAETEQQRAHREVYHRNGQGHLNEDVVGNVRPRESRMV